MSEELTGPAGEATMIILPNWQRNNCSPDSYLLLTDQRSFSGQQRWRMQMLPGDHTAEDKYLRCTQSQMGHLSHMPSKAQDHQRGGGRKMSGRTGVTVSSNYNGIFMLTNSQQL